MTIFNLNDYILIHINDIGWKHLKSEVGEDYIKHCIFPHKEREKHPYTGEVIDYYRLQAHQAMDILGGCIHGFDTNILIPDKTS